MPWRPMSTQDLAAVKSLADRIHIDHPEDMHVFTERLQLYPAGCHVLADRDDLAGYALSHPWRLGAPPALNTPLREIPEHSETYYIHDIALLPEGRGKGHAGAVVKMLAEHAMATGFGSMSLVAVNGSREFWERLGFRTAMTAVLKAKLSSYGGDALLMRRELKL
ncbi:GNAT family N-acetyltransferase [Microvirga sp. 2TAF3]|uniref:GNAT family N-acetyltransferase n=1 Tax=Microvirga sp. 2TAF3 TaxID=3233014 RepID=UPI003F9AC082